MTEEKTFKDYLITIVGIFSAFIFIKLFDSILEFNFFVTLVLALIASSLVCIVLVFFIAFFQSLLFKKQLLIYTARLSFSFQFPIDTRTAPCCAMQVTVIRLASRRFDYVKRSVLLFSQPLQQLFVIYILRSCVFVQRKLSGAEHFGSNYMRLIYKGFRRLTLAVSLLHLPFGISFFLLPPLQPSL